MTQKYPIKMGVDLVFEGDHQHHRIDLGAYGDDVETVWDDSSIVLTIRLDEADAKELFFDLMVIIPKLRADRK